MNIDNLSEREIISKEAEQKVIRSEVKPIFQPYGSFENFNSTETSSKEAEQKVIRSEINPTFQHYGSAENMNDNDIRTMESQVAEKRKQDIPYTEYLNNLVANPIISDPEQFEDAVNRSMQSNRLMNNFTTKLVEEISKETYAFKRIDKTDIESIRNQKQKVENLVSVYEKYLYTLKKNGWTFYGTGNDIGLEMITSDMLDDLWQVQKNFDLTFNMPIPKNLGENYGQAFEREGKMVPGITLMYDDLKNKQVNWHQVLIYKENELTPSERHKKSKEEALKQFELARQQEIQKALELSHAQTMQNDFNMGNPEEINTSSIRR